MHLALNLSFVTPGEMGGLEVHARQLTLGPARRGDLELSRVLHRMAAEAEEWREPDQTFEVYKRVLASREHG